MNTAKSQFNLRRRRFLQLTAGAAGAQTALSSLPFSSSALGSTASAAEPLVTVNENYATYMAMSLSAGTWAFDAENSGQKILQGDELQRHKNKRIGSAQKRCVELFSFYSFYNAEQILSAQKTEGWKAHLSHHVSHMKSLKGGPLEATYDDFSHVPSIFADDVVTQELVLQGLINVINEILDDVDAGVCPLPLGAGTNRLGSYTHYFPDLKSSDLAALSLREHMELFLEFSRSDYVMNVFPRGIGTRREWFGIPDSLPPIPEFIVDKEHIKSSGIPDLYLEKIAPFKTFPEQLKSYFGDDFFSIDEYFQRRDRFASELDLLFAKRELKKRLQMKQEVLSSRENTRTPISSWVGNILTPPMSLVRSVAAVRGVFSKVSEKFTQAVHDGSKSMARDYAEDARDPMQALEYKPQDNLFDQPIVDLGKQSDTVCNSRSIKPDGRFPA